MNEKIEQRGGGAFVKSNTIFIVLVWLCSRIIVWVPAMVVAQHAGWQAFNRWDGPWYGQIATHGYDYAPNGQRHSVAFLPLFPLLASPLVHVGVPWAIAGTLVNTVAFFGALFVVFDYVQRRAGRIAARWSVATLAFLPLSLFGSVAYSEGLYILCSALTLRAFDRERYAEAALFGLLSSATRLTGLALASGLLIAAFAERRGPRAVAAALASSLGAAAYATFLAWRFGDPLASVHAQTAWRAAAGFDWAAWFEVLRMGFNDAKPVPQLIALVLLVFWWFRLRSSLSIASFIVAAVIVAIEAWAWSYDAMTMLLIVGGTLAVLAFRKRLGVAACAYWLVTVAMLFLGGTPFSVDRNAYAVVPVIMAFGLAWVQLPSLGVATLAAGAYGLALDAAAFAAWKWVA